MGYSGIGKGDGRSLGHPRRTGAAQGIGSPPHAMSLDAVCPNTQHPALLNLEGHLSGSPAPKFSSAPGGHADCALGA